MKGMELFDMLGEIDDKFFEEAAPPDIQRPVEIAAEKRGLKRTLLGIVMPIAACIAIVAAIGIGIGFIGQNTFLRPNISLSEYTALDKENTQDIQPKVILDTKELDDYKILLLAHDVRNEYIIFPLSGLPNIVYHDIMCSELFVVLEKDGKAVAQSDDLDIGHLDFDRLSEYIQPFELKDGKGFALYSYISEKRGDARFYSIKSNKMIQLKNTRPPEPEEEVEIKPSLTVNYENDTLISGGSIISINFSNNSYTITEKIDLDDYRVFDQYNTELQPKVILEVKELGDYRIYLLGHDAKLVLSDDLPDFVNCSRLLLVLEKGGEVFDTIDAENMALHLNALNNFVQPFEMKDGIGIAMCYRFYTSGEQDTYTMLYKLDNDMIIKLKSDSQPGYISNTQHYIYADCAVIPETNEIAVDAGIITINFAGNSYTIEEPDLRDYLPYDRNSTELQPKVILGTKSVGDYDIILLGNNVKNGSYAGVADAVHSGCTYLVLVKEGRIVSVMGGNRCIYQAGDDLAYSIKPFEMDGGIGFVMFGAAESWCNSLVFGIINIIKDGEIITYSDKYVSSWSFFNFTVDKAQNTIIDDEDRIIIDFENNTFTWQNS